MNGKECTRKGTFGVISENKCKGVVGRDEGDRGLTVTTKGHTGTHHTVRRKRTPDTHCFTSKLLSIED